MTPEREIDLRRRLIFGRYGAVYKRWDECKAMHEARKTNPAAYDIWRETWTAENNAALSSAISRIESGEVPEQEPGDLAALKELLAERNSR